MIPVTIPLFTHRRYEGDRRDWQTLLRDEKAGVPLVYATLFSIADRFEGTTRTSWALNLLVKICLRASGGIDPKDLPRDTRTLREAFDEATSGMSHQVKKKAVFILRQMLAGDVSLAGLLHYFPRRANTTTDPVNRQKHVVEEDSIPAKLKPEWLREVFRRLLAHPKSRNWKTSASAKQNICMTHKFLRTTDLLDSADVETFEERIRGLEPSQIAKWCLDFTDTLCTPRSAKGYFKICNHFFHAVYGVLPSPLTASTRKRRVLTLQELDDHLSSNGSSHRTGGGNNHTYLTVEETDRLIASSLSSSIRDSLIVTLLSTTGLRRRGLLNIQVTSVASRDEKGRWTSDTGGQTLEKGRKIRTFPLFPSVQEHLEKWLNTIPAEGGRPWGPSPYLFPSDRVDNGQMSTSTLMRIFVRLCTNAGIDKARAHPHILRHSCAHRLLEAGNTARQIAAYIGHSQSSTTEKFWQGICWDDKSHSPSTGFRGEHHQLHASSMG